MNKPLSRRHAWPPSDGGRCNLRGVLKITLQKWPQSVSYHIAVDNSTLFSLNIGESLSNNTWGNGRWEGGSKEGLGKEGEYKRRVGGREGGVEGGMEEGRESGREEEGGSKGMVGEGEREGESKGREVGSDDARQAESVSGGREG